MATDVAGELLDMEAPMAYDEALAERMRSALPGIPGITEKKMFGGIAFLVDGNMACGVSKDNLMVRIHPEATDTALAQPNVRIFDMSGRPMKGWVLVEPAGIESDDDLKRWVDQGVTFAQSLPPK
jgi:TfoX/Sxy family transcriptional regulator of competence genes